jgi:Lon protease-like protein
MPTFPTDGPDLVTSDRLPVLPLRDVVVFPYVVMPLLVGRPASLAAIDAGNEEDRLVLLVAQRDPETQEPAAADLYRVGVVARIRQISRLGTGTVRVLVEGAARARVTRYVPGTDCLSAIVEPMPAPALGEGDEVLLRRALSLFEEYVALHRRLPAELVTIIQSADSPARQAFGVAAHLGTRLDRRQALLAIDELPALLRSLGEDFCVLAHAKGTPQRVVVWKHGLRNALLPTTTLLGLQLGFMVGGAVLTETIFAYPGVGREIYESVIRLDFPVLQGAFVLLALTVVVANMLTDLAYGLLDPRVRNA